MTSVKSNNLVFQWLHKCFKNITLIKNEVAYVYFFWEQLCVHTLVNIVIIESYLYDPAILTRYVLGKLFWLFLLHFSKRSVTATQSNMESPCTREIKCVWLDMRKDFSSECDLFWFTFCKPCFWLFLRNTIKRIMSEN